MDESKEYYKNLSELKEFEIDTILKPSIELLEINGIIYLMLKDIESYGLKVGFNKKYKDSIDMVLNIQRFIDKSNLVNDHNYQLRHLLKRSMTDRDLLIKKVKDLELKIESINLAFDAE